MATTLEDLTHAGHLDTLLARVPTLPDPDAKALLGALIPAVQARCAQDGLFWLRWVRTRDEADPEQSIKPFPLHLDYIRSLWSLLVEHQCVVVAKSRQMLVSWCVVAFCVWWARYKAHQAIYWQTQQWRDATGMTCMAEGGVTGRAQFIERSLPAWMRLPVKEQEGTLTYPNGSMIQALAGGADQVRGKVASIIVEDEFAKQEEATGVYVTVAPLIQKGAKLIVVSTPNGTMNQFATLYHGRPVGLGG